MYIEVKVKVLEVVMVNVGGEGTWRWLVSRSQTLYLPLLATRGGKGLAHTNRASGSGLHQKTVKPHSMNLVKDGTCQNDFCASESCITNVGLASLMNSVWSVYT